MQLGQAIAIFLPISWSCLEPVQSQLSVCKQTLRCRLFYASAILYYRILGLSWVESHILSWQAAEAYANKNKTTNTSHSTWSASSSRARSRPGLSSDLFQAPEKTSRTASASPGLQRKRLNSRSDVSEREEQAVTSTHSTPSRRPNTRRQNSKVHFVLLSYL